MGNVIKSYRYRIVDNSAFEMPLPVKFTIWKADAPVAEYIISEDEKVTYNIITRYKELMITTIHRSLDISDIYYLFSCRVFQNRTPFTPPILERMGLEKYNVYNILQRTHGISPYDDYWIRFDGENITYEQAEEDFDKYLIGPEVQPVPVVSYPSGKAPEPAAKAISGKKVDEILNQKRVNFDEMAKEAAKPVQIAPDTSYEPQQEIENNKMSADEIEALLKSCGVEPENGAIESSEKMPDVDPASRSVAEPESSGGKMSQEDIEKLLAANTVSAPEPEPAPEPVAEPQSSGGKMSQEDIEKLLAANNVSAPEPEPAPEPVTEPQSSGGKMSQEDIEKLLAANTVSAPEPEPAPEPAAEPQSSGGKMSQEDIEKLLAANTVAAPEPEPAPEPVAEPESSGGKMSQEDIEKLLAANTVSAPEPEPAPEPVTEPQSSGGKMSQEDIEALLNSMQEEANK